MGDEKLFGFTRFPPFELGKPRFPQGSFLGRYLHYLDVVDPSTLFVSEKRLQECVALLDAVSRGEKVTASNRELWRAQQIKQAILHPDTGEKVFPAFRMSGFVPFGWITVTGMLLPNPSWGTLLFWQWMNQTHNALVNYSNRNATRPQPVSKFVGAYAAAVSAAISISAGLTYFLKNASSLPPATRLIVQRFVPLPATSLASSGLFSYFFEDLAVNVLCMRSNEIKSGIEVYDKNKNVVGVSKVAAKQAVTDTTLTRAFLPVPLLLLPPCIMPFLEKYFSLWTHLLKIVLVCTLSFAASLPVALALFPQESEIDVARLEEDIREKATSKTLFYNKGL